MGERDGRERERWEREMGERDGRGSDRGGATES